MTLNVHSVFRPHVVLSSVSAKHFLWLSMSTSWPSKIKYDWCIWFAAYTFPIHLAHLNRVSIALRLTTRRHWIFVHSCWPWMTLNVRSVFCTHTVLIKASKKVHPNWTRYSRTICDLILCDFQGQLQDIRKSSLNGAFYSQYTMSNTSPYKLRVHPTPFGS